MNKIIAGDTVTLTHTLTAHDGTVLDLSLAASVKMQLRRGNDVVGPEVTCSSGTTGADWSVGVLVGVMSAVQSAALAEMDRVQLQTTFVLDGVTRTAITPLSESIKIIERAS